MIKLGVSITYLEIIEISDEEIAEYREEFPDATLDDIKQTYIDDMLENGHYYGYNDVEYGEIE